MPLAVLVGGKSKAHELTVQRARDLASEIATAVEGAGGSVLVTFSRRTPEDAKRFMTNRLKRLPGWVWDGDGWSKGALSGLSYGEALSDD